MGLEYATYVSKHSVFRANASVNNYSGIWKANLKK